MEKRFEIGDWVYIRELDLYGKIAGPVDNDGYFPVKITAPAEKNNGEMEDVTWTELFRESQIRVANREKQGPYRVPFGYPFKGIHTVHYPEYPHPEIIYVAKEAPIYRAVHPEDPLPENHRDLRDLTKDPDLGESIVTFFTKAFDACETAMNVTRNILNPYMGILDITVLPFGERLDENTRWVTMEKPVFVGYYPRICGKRSVEHFPVICIGDPVKEGIEETRLRFHHSELLPERVRELFGDDCLDRGYLVLRFREMVWHVRAYDFGMVKPMDFDIVKDWHLENLHGQVIQLRMNDRLPLPQFWYEGFEMYNPTPVHRFYDDIGRCRNRNYLFKLFCVYGSPADAVKTSYREDPEGDLHDREIINGPREEFNAAGESDKDVIFELKQAEAREELDKAVRNLDAMEEQYNALPPEEKAMRAAYARALTEKGATDDLPY